MVLKWYYNRNYFTYQEAEEGNIYHAISKTFTHEESLKFDRTEDGILRVRI